MVYISHIRAGHICLKVIINGIKMAEHNYVVNGPDVNNLDPASLANIEWSHPTFPANYFFPFQPRINVADFGQTFGLLV